MKKDVFHVHHVDGAHAHWVETMGYVYVYTGNGAGKTMNAIGLAVRCVGHEKKAIIIQFLKYWKGIGEYKIKEKLKPYYEIYQFGRPGWLKIKDGKKNKVKVNGYEFKVRSVSELDKKLCKKALEFARKKLKEKPTLLVLDEINLAICLGLIEINEVLLFVKSAPKETNIILTGRYAPKKILEIADFVNIIIDKKAPKNIITTKGIQY